MRVPDGRGYFAFSFPGSPMNERIANHIEPPVLDIDPFTDETVRNPYPFFETMREAGPVVFIKPHGFYAVGRHEELGIVASDYKRFTSEGGIGMSDIRKPGAWRARSPISEVDPPSHTGVRATLQKILSPAVVRTWKEDFQSEAIAVVDEILDKGEIDAVTELVERFVLTVFPRQMGIDVPKERLLMTGELNFNQQGPMNDRLKAAFDKAAPFMDWYAAQLKRDKMLPGGFGKKIFEAEDRGEFEAGTGELHVRSFFRAGTDTTMAGIGFALNQLARSAEQYDQVRAAPALVRNAFEEAIRHESPAQLLFRTTTEEVELSGCRLHGDVKVGLFFGCANRDPRRWADPGKYDVDRQVLGEHRAFGAGAHMCIGQMIARLEAESILTELVKRVRRIELTGEVEYKLNNTLRTLKSLPLRLVKA